MVGVISFIIVIVGVVLYFNLDSVFANSLTTEELVKAKIMFVILINSIVLS